MIRPVIDWGRSLGWNMDNMKIVKGRGEKKEFYTLKFDWPPASTDLFKKAWHPTQVTKVKVEITHRDFEQPSCHTWRKTFCILPRQTITGKRVFFETAYVRRFYAVWGFNFHTEPHVEYATLFEVLAENGL